MTGLWEHYGHIKLVTPPEVKWQGRRCWFQGNTVFIGRANGDMTAYEAGMERFTNFIPPHRGRVRIRAGRGLTIRNKAVLRLLGYHPFNDCPAYVGHSLRLWLQIVAWRLWKRPIR